MTDTLHLQFAWQDIPVNKLANRLTGRFFGPLRWVVVILAVTVMFASYVLLHASVFRHETGPQMATILAAVFCALTLGLGNTLGHKRLQVSQMAAPIRQQGCSLAINANGIATQGAVLPNHVDWSEVTEIVEMGGFVLIMLSPVEYVPIPVFALPEGIERAELVEVLRSWHAGGQARAELLQAA